VTTLAAMHPHVCCMPMLHVLQANAVTLRYEARKLCCGQIQLLDMFRRNKGHYKEIYSMKFCKMINKFAIVCIFSLVICVHIQPIL
jgi:hypothetical protein